MNMFKKNICRAYENILLSFKKENINFKKKYFCNCEKKDVNKIKFTKHKKENGHTFSHLFLETEIYFEFKANVFYRGRCLRSLCEMSTFDEIVFLLLYKKMPNKTELNENINYLKKEYIQFVENEKNIIKIMKILKNNNLLELIRICILNLSLFEENNKDMNLNYYKILAISLRLLSIFYSQNNLCENIFTDKEYDNVCLFILQNYSNNNMLESNTPKLKWNENKDVEKVDEIMDKSETSKTDKEKLLNVLLTLICETNINENIFLLRLISNMNEKNNYFNIYLCAITFYIDTFKNINFDLSFKSFLNLDIYSKEQTEDDINDIIMDIPNVDLFFYKNNFFLKKKNILKKYLTDYCNNQSQQSIYILNHFTKIEDIFLKYKNKYPSPYYYSMLTFYLLNIPVNLLPTIYFLSRLPSIIAHINEQKQNKKIVKYSSIYVGNLPTDIYQP
ncbi:citrate synthase-like protein, putative [Plasmodium berghei]|uniref:Citrate synthase-like protein, putative n=2 Tax=Plasmodium berghei TaxID=5821 RepID=A0A509ABW1_PLABA|nr:citrate synthase-like protein, putative [Plasmodium berghei ANKA]CXH82052.1 citrate synthase-like protein, putative [Plasmodium berghei]SCM19170.1 citrate synthase-like protein, putative [Plasmodium berghei]SCN21627.1 citrate synthase-like protein, putative [Plasmodium berghei]SCO58870.1 citrate synthase-like protein, putative [Plasmodium berghei]SCO58944.1 citrate synthase-like protein, putative [Plasmodium berghei]|eukprot:XP_034419678.1 citrate synthase-like protein, putative [Plasmodium berghei ANKA]